jgi:ribosomal protein L11 methyltransferase
MISIYLECDPEERDALIAELHERGTLGVLELGSGLRAWFEDDAGLQDVIERYDGEILVEEDVDWVQRTRDSFPPLAIGDRFWLVPEWNRDPAPPGRMRLEINPGLACGTGWHPCTKLCLEAMERYVRPGDAVLDAGAGSGILSVAAELLGAGLIAGCDIDLDSVAIARDRAGDRVFAGSVDAVRGGVFDVVVANISAPVVTSLLPEFRRVLKPGGVLIASGFPSIPPIPGTLETRERDGWQCVIVRWSPED